MNLMNRVLRECGCEDDEGELNERDVAEERLEVEGR